MTTSNDQPLQPLALLTLEAAAEQLQMTPRQLAALALRREIAPAKLGRNWFFDQAGLQEYYDRQRNPSRYRRMPDTTDEHAPARDWGRRTKG